VYDRKQQVTVFPKLENGTIRVLYVTPLILSGDLRDKLREPVFGQRLSAVSFDECGILPDWEGIRENYNIVKEVYGNLLNSWRYVCPFICLSSTVTRQPAADLIQYPYSTDSMTRIGDNVNLIVAPIRGSTGNIRPLLDLVPRDLTDPCQIPKTIIYYDLVGFSLAMEGVGLAMEMRSLLPKQFHVQPCNSIIRCMYGGIDLGTRMKSLSEFRDGTVRIMLCFDPWGLSVEAPDVERVIQWKVNEMLDFFSLNERLAKVTRNRMMEGIAIIYVQEDVLSKLSSVTLDTEDEVGHHVLKVYQEARRIRDRMRAINKKRRGRGEPKYPKILDPGVVWVISTTGCRRLPFQVMYQLTQRV
jgi:hypothetical protein